MENSRTPYSPIECIHSPYIYSISWTPKACLFISKGRFPFPFGLVCCSFSGFQDEWKTKLCCKTNQKDQRGKKSGTHVSNFLAIPMLFLLITLMKKSCEEIDMYLLHF